LRKKAELKVRVLSKGEWKACRDDAKNIVSLGSAGFIMQLTNSLVTICCNSVLSGIGGDVYISVMTIVSSVRQMVETPIYAINEGTSPILSYNYGAQRPKKVKKAICVLTCMILIYTAITWSVIIFEPEFLIGIFSTDRELLADCVGALKLYFAAFIFMDLQYVGQTVFKSLNKKKQAIFFSLLRKVFIVVPLTYLFPYAFHMGTKGVFLAEPISNVIGGSLCFITMLVMLKRSI
jgi:Na+-driven multidrug efflux pump